MKLAHNSLHPKTVS